MISHMVLDPDLNHTLPYLLIGVHGLASGCVTLLEAATISKTFSPCLVLARYRRRSLSWFHCRAIEHYRPLGHSPFPNGTAPVDKRGRLLTAFNSPYKRANDQGSVLRRCTQMEIRPASQGI